MGLTRRTLFTLSGGLAATAALTACGSSGGRSAAPLTTPGATPNPDAGRPALSQWYHAYRDPGVEEAVKRWAAAYLSAEVTVNWVLSEYEAALAAALQTSTAPDVFEYANGPTLEMIRSGQVADLTDTIGGARDDFTPSVLARLTHEDRIWAIPQAVDMQVLYYRKDLLAARNLTPPTTLAELTHVANSLASDGSGGFFAGLDGGLGVLGLLLMWASGVDEMDQTRTAATFDTPALHEGVAQYKALFDSPGLVRSASADWFDPAPFVTGEVALQWGGSWDLPRMLAAFGDDVGVLPFPAICEAGRPVVPFAAYSSCVLAESEHLTAARNFAKWLWVDSEDKQVEFADSFGTHIPAKPVLFPRTTQVSEGPGAEAAAFVTDHGRTTDLYWTPASAQAYATALSNVVVGGADVATEFAAAASTVDAELRRLA